MTNRVEQLYDYLADEEDSRVCEDIPDSACDEVPGNALLIFLSQTLTKLADALLNPKVVLPSLLSSSGAPAFFAGILVPIRESGSMLPQLMIGGVVRKHPIRKWFFSIGAVLQALAVLAIAWSAVTLTGSEAGIWITACLIFFSLARGLCSVASKDVLGKTIPKTRRGLISGYCASAAGLLSIACGVAIYLLDDQSNRVYAMMLIAAACAWLLAAFLYARIDEYKGAVDGGKNGLSEALTSFSLLKSDRTFRDFVLFRSFLMVSALSAPYLVLTTQSMSHHSSLTNVGVFIIVNSLASFCSGFFWGKLADKSSRKLMLTTAITTTVICLVAAMLTYTNSASHYWVMLTLFFLLCITHEGIRLGRKTYIVDIASGNKRTDYVAVSNTLIGFLLLVVGLSSALLAQLNIAALLLLFAACAAMAAWKALRLPEVQH